MTKQQTDDVVSMRGVTMVYPNGVAANQEVDFSVRRGEIHALMGENGAGKSTLMKILFGMEQPTQGAIYLYGEKVAMTSPTGRHRARRMHGASALHACAEPHGGGEHRSGHDA